MSTHNCDMESRWVNALRTQSKIEPNFTGPFPCPYGHHGRVFQNIEQLWAHTEAEHATQIVNMETTQARIIVRDLALKLRNWDQSLDATAGSVSVPDITDLSLDPGKERKSPPHSSKKRRADSEFNTRRKAPPTHAGVADPAFSRDILHMVEKQPRKPADPQTPAGLPRRPGLTELPKYDSRYPGLLLQPDSRPISQEQLASEVKSIYAGLTMVEVKCIDVDGSLAHARQAKTGQKLSSEHWQALIALHRTLLHEHHDFFLASQHPSASPALRRLAAKYNMPGRMWGIGILPFLDELEKRDKDNDPDCGDHMMAFICIAYQMVALLYETVPVLEVTWMEYLGNLSRYRMAIEDRESQDYETWSGVARSWYLKAADKTPLVGRLPHHLAILAQSSALQQLHYYAVSMSSWEPFQGARESILNLVNYALDPDPEENDSHVLEHAIQIDASFVKTHAHLYVELSTPGFETSSSEFTANLDNHISRATAQWKEQGVHVAVSNIAAWFSYGLNLNIFRQIFLLLAYRRRPASEKPLPTPKEPYETSSVPHITESEIPSLLNAFVSTPTFSKAATLTNDTFALVLRRIGDQNVLPHVHVMLSFLTTIASTPHVTDTIEKTPWNELVSFLNTLIKIETRKSQIQDVNALLTTSLFPDNGNVKERDEYPLPEDYQMRGLIWAQDYFPENWFGKEHDEGDRNLELASTSKSRIERVLRLGYRLSTFDRWISYDKGTHTFSTIDPSCPISTAAT